VAVRYIEPLLDGRSVDARAVFRGSPGSVVGWQGGTAFFLSATIPERWFVRVDAKSMVKWCTIGSLPGAYAKRIRDFQNVSVHS